MKTKEEKHEYYLKNRDRIKAKSHQWYLRNKDRRIAMNRVLVLKKKYGMTPGDYDELLSKQKGKCAICDEPITSVRHAIDHDHYTGEVRGLLCLHCNTGLGHFRESIALLHWAANYLSGYKLQELWERKTA